jgi:hypothetical protein
LKKDLRCIQYEVKKLKGRSREPTTVEERAVTLQPSELADLREEVGQLRERLRQHRNN